MPKYLKPPFTYVGCKTKLLPHLLPLQKHKTYVELFAGSCALLFAKQPSKIEIINDINNDIVNFFQVLREQPEELKRLLTNTPYSREEHKRCKSKYPTENNPLEKARVFYVLLCQSYGAKFNNSFAISYNHNNAIMNKNKVDKLLECSERLREVFIECLDWSQIINKYDAQDTLFFADPPYYPTVCSKQYLDCLTIEHHQNLLNTLLKAKGNAIVCGYDCEMYNDLLCNWQKKTVYLQNSLTSQKSNTRKKEILWFKQFDCQNLAFPVNL